MRGSTAGGTSKFLADLAAYNPLRLYKLDDFTNGGSMLDSGSQAVNGTYASGAAFNVAPGLVPGSKNCVCLTAPSAQGAVFSATGLPTGANRWTMGVVTYIWFPSPSTGVLLQWNNLILRERSGSIYEVVTPAGSVNLAAAMPSLVLVAATYDGTTTTLYVISASPTGGNNILGTASAAQSLALTTASGQIIGGNGDFLEQHAFIIGSTLIQAQLQALAQDISQIQ